MNQIAEAILAYERIRCPGAKPLEFSEEDFDMDGTPAHGVLVLFSDGGDKYCITLLSYAKEDEADILKSIQSGEAVQEDADFWPTGAELGDILDDMEEEELSQVQKDFVWACRKYVPINVKDLN